MGLVKVNVPREAQEETHRGTAQSFVHKVSDQVAYNIKRQQWRDFTGLILADWKEVEPQIQSEEEVLFKSYKCSILYIDGHHNPPQTTRTL